LAVFKSRKAYKKYHKGHHGKRQLLALAFFWGTVPGFEKLVMKSQYEGYTLVNPLVEGKGVQREVESERS
jgi:hypothetical protein